MTTFVTRMPSPVGDLLLAGDGVELSAIWIDGQRWAPVVGTDWRAEAGPFDDATRQLREYFAGTRMAFDLPLRTAGTPFQRQVWYALRQIPFGETRTYGAIAAGLGRASAARAVGAANGQNPFCIVVPCHRLIGSRGALVNYAAGLDVKRRLLEHEACVSRRAGARPPAPPSRVRTWARPSTPS